MCVFLSWDVMPEKLYQGLLCSKCVFSHRQTSFPFDIFQIPGILLLFVVSSFATGQECSCRDNPIIHTTPCSHFYPNVMDLIIYLFVCLFRLLFSPHVPHLLYSIADSEDIREGSKREMLIGTKVPC